MDTHGRRLIAVGVTHRTSSVEQRAHLQLAAEELTRANRALLRLPAVRESAVVSTCNRVEFYLVADDDTDPTELLGAFYDRMGCGGSRRYLHLFENRHGRAAAHHLFRVAAGVDSAVVGESEVLGQVKDAYSAACAAGSAGKLIHRLFHQAFRVGKRVRTDTGIGRGACSVGSAAVEMLGERLAERHRTNVLIVGVNRMTRIAATRLAADHRCRLTFANRTASKAEALADTVGAEGYGLEVLPMLMSRSDVAIFCTSSPDPIVTREMMAGVSSGRASRPIVLVDLAVPRDVDVPDGWDPRVEVIDLDDIGRFVAGRQREREREVPHAEAIIRGVLDEFQRWCDLEAGCTDFDLARHQPHLEPLSESGADRSGAVASSGRR
jgi:glutamyl-tRNA reductase